MNNDQPTPPTLEDLKQGQQELEEKKAHLLEGLATKEIVPIGSSHLHHLYNNLLSAVTNATVLVADGYYEDEKDRLYLISLAKTSLDAAGTYVDLLENYPRFAKAELTTQKGMFPDIFDLQNVDNIAEAKRRLVAMAQFADTVSQGEAGETITPQSIGNADLDTPGDQ